MKRKSSGFTLIELLVVISIIALLVSILMPALNKAKQQATASVCLANSRSLTQAYLMYSDDNDGRIVGGYVARQTLDSPRSYDNQWVFSPRVNDDDWYDNIGLRDGVSPSPVLDDRLTGIKAGRLFKYIKNTDVYHCPGDKRLTNPKVANAGLDNMIYRSYSIPDCLAGHEKHKDGNSWYSYLQKVITTFSQIKTPSEKYVFVEVNFPGSQTMPFNHGGFSFDPWSNTYWWDPPAPFHNRGGIFGFLDGHSEMYKWRDKSTITHTESGLGSGNVQFDPDGDHTNLDVDYMVQGWPENRTGKYNYSF